MEGVALLLGGKGDALAERTEERVREDHAQRLWGQQPKGHRAAAG